MKKKPRSADLNAFPGAGTERARVPPLVLDPPQRGERHLADIQRSSRPRQRGRALHERQVSTVPYLRNQTLQGIRGNLRHCRAYGIFNLYQQLILMTFERAPLANPCSFYSDRSRANVLVLERRCFAPISCPLTQLVSLLDDFRFRCVECCNFVSCQVNSRSGSPVYFSLFLLYYSPAWR